MGEGVIAWNVQTGDVDNDGTVEIIAVGCMYISALCDPDLRIYSIVTNQNPVLLYGIIIAVVVILAVIALLVLKKKE